MEGAVHYDNHMEATMAFFGKIEQHLAGEQKEEVEEAVAETTNEIEAIFSKLGGLVDEKVVSATGAVFAYDVTGDNAGKWFMDLKNGGGSVGKGDPPGKADCTFTLDSEIFVQMFTGKLNPTSAFMSGKLKMKGDMGKAMKLQKVMDKMK